MKTKKNNLITECQTTINELEQDIQNLQRIINDKEQDIKDLTRVIEALKQLR